MPITTDDLATALRYEGEVAFETVTGGTLRGILVRVTRTHVQLEHGFRVRDELVSVRFSGLVGRPFGQYLCDKPAPIPGFGNVHETSSLGDMISLMDDIQRVLILVRVDGEIEYVSGRITKVSKDTVEINGCIVVPRSRVVGYAKSI